ncbi:hypothetical protein NE237_030665 [Protea cynaroides]|uniref:Uncharacterized protein n=1 Tax=Protea cynaroides TaxID=273540 RepID=A0A9Q0GU65_9MAGN|nr:hypothetical protein NE237_030665 [Protea cynaroides]
MVVSQGQSSITAQRTHGSACPLLVGSLCILKAHRRARSRVGSPLSDDGSASPPETKSLAPSRDAHYPNGFLLEAKLPGSTAVRNYGGRFIDELDLTGCFRRMHISGAEKDSSTEMFKVENPQKLQFDDHSPIGTKHSRLGENGCNEDYKFFFFNNGGLQRSAHAGPTSFNDETRSALFRLQREGKMGNLSGSNASPVRHEAPFIRICRYPPHRIFSFRRTRSCGGGELGMMTFFPSSNCGICMVSCGVTIDVSNTEAGALEGCSPSSFSLLRLIGSEDYKAGLDMCIYERLSFPFFNDLLESMNFQIFYTIDLRGLHNWEAKRRHPYHSQKCGV